MIAARLPFGVLVGDEGIAAVAKTRPRPQPARPLTVPRDDQVRIERPGIEVEPSPGREAAAIAFIRMERASGQAMEMVARSDPLGRDAELLDPNGRQPVEGFGIATGEILGVIRLVGRHMDAQREADPRAE